MFFFISNRALWDIRFPNVERKHWNFSKKQQIIYSLNASYFSMIENSVYIKHAKMAQTQHKTIFSIFSLSGIIV